MIRPLLAFLCAGALAATSIPCVAADHILLYRLGPTRATLFVANADGTHEQALTQQDSFNYDPSWSPNGDWIAFTSERTGPAELFRMHPDGSGLEQLTDQPAYNDQAAFSPDGERIVFVSTRAGGHANLWLLDIPTRKATPLTSGDGGDFRPSWSPDGRWIAFSSDRGSDLPPAKGRWERLQVADVYLIHPDGSGLRQLSQHGGFCGSPKWKPDSKSVVAYCMTAQETWTYRFGDEEGSDKLIEMPVAGGTRIEIKSGPGVKLQPAVLPSGEIGYLRRDKSASGIYYGKGTAGPKGVDLRTPSWSPDGKRVVYSRYERKAYVQPIKQWSRNNRFEIYATGLLPASDPSGQYLATTKLIARDTASLVVLQAGREPRTILTRKELILAPSWAPDSKRIVIGVGEFSSFLGFDIGEKKPVRSGERWGAGRYCEHRWFGLPLCHVGTK